MTALRDVFGLGGNVIDGQFHAIEVAGEGGFSVVYRGEHLSMQVPVAIKCLKLAAGGDPEVIASFTQRFFDESRISYRLSQGNLNVVRSITTGVTLAPTTGQSVPYMVLEWLEGKSLTAALRARREARCKGRPLDEVIAMFDPVASALGYAHSQGIAHRDIKPGNIFVVNAPDGERLKVLDFGMAKVFDSATAGFEGVATIGGLVVVSPQYSAPEQFDPGVGPVGAWTDVYSFALVLLEAMADRRVRESGGLTDVMLAASDRKPPPSPRSMGLVVGDGVEGVFSSALARLPRERPKDVADFWSRLKDAAQRDRAAHVANAGRDAANGSAPSTDGTFARTIATPMQFPRELAGVPPSASSSLNRTLVMADRPALPSDTSLDAAPISSPPTSPMPRTPMSLSKAAVVAEVDSRVIAARESARAVASAPPGAPPTLARAMAAGDADSRIAAARAAVAESLRPRGSVPDFAPPAAGWGSVPAPAAPVEPALELTPRRSSVVVWLAVAMALAAAAVLVIGAWVAYSHVLHR